MLPFYPTIQYTNEHTKPNDRILLFGMSGEYYLERDSINASFWGGEMMFYSLKTAEKLVERLQELEIRYVIAKKPERETAERLDWKLFNELEQNGTLTPMYTKNGYTLYRFRSPTLKLTE